MAGCRADDRTMSSNRPSTWGLMTSRSYIPASIDTAGFAFTETHR